MTHKESETIRSAFCTVELFFIERKSTERGASEFHHGHGNRTGNKFLIYSGKSNTETKTTLKLIKINENQLKFRTKITRYMVNVAMCWANDVNWTNKMTDFRFIDFQNEQKQKRTTKTELRFSFVEFCLDQTNNWTKNCQLKMRRGNSIEMNHVLCSHTINSCVSRSIRIETRIKIDAKHEYWILARPNDDTKRMRETRFVLIHSECERDSPVSNWFSKFRTCHEYFSSFALLFITKSDKSVVETHDKQNNKERITNSLFILSDQKSRLIRVCHSWNQWNSLSEICTHEIAMKKTLNFYPRIFQSSKLSNGIKNTVIASFIFHALSSEWRLLSQPSTD